MAIRNKGSLIGSILIIAIGIFTFVSMFDTLQNLQGQISLFYGRQQMADVFAEVEGIPEADLLRMENIPGVAGADGRIAADVRLLFEGQEGMTTVHLMSAEPGDRINRVILEGRDSSDSLFLGTRMQDAYGFHEGDNLRILTGEGVSRFSFAGTCAAPDYIYTVPPWGAMVPDGSAYDIACVSPERMRKITGSDCRTEIFFRLEEGYTWEMVRAQLKKELEPYGLKSITPKKDQASFSMVEGEYGELLSTGTLLPVLFMLISVFMLYVVQKKMIDRDQRLIGTMKAFGLTDRELLLAYLLQGLAIGVLGAIIGGLFAGILGRYMFSLYVDFFNLPDPVYHDYLQSRMAGLLIAGLTSLLAVFSGVKGILSITPAMAMRPASPEQGRMIRLPAWLLARTKAMGKMALRSLSRNRFRGFLMALSVAFPFALSSVLLSFPLVVDEMIETEFSGIENYDIQVSLDRYVSPEAAKNAAMELPGVRDAEGVLTAAAEITRGGKSEYVLLHALHPDSGLWRIQDNEGGRHEPPSGGLLLNRAVAGKLGAGSGDEVWIFIGGAMPEKRRVTLAGVIDEPFGEGAYLDIGAMPSVLGVPPAANMAILSAGGSGRKSAIGRLKDSPRVSWLVDMSRARKNYADMMESMVIMIDCFAVLSVIAGGILIYNISMMNIRDRVNELTTLSVLGATAGEIGRMLLLEHGVLFGLGILMGIPGNLGIRRLLEKVMLSDTYAVSLKAYPAPCAAAFLFCLGTLLVAWRAEMRMLGNMDLTEALKGGD